MDAVLLQALQAAQAARDSHAAHSLQQQWALSRWQLTGDALHDLLESQTGVAREAVCERTAGRSRQPEGMRVEVGSTADAQKLLKAATDAATEIMVSAEAGLADNSNLCYGFGRLYVPSAGGRGPAASLTVADLSALQLAHGQHFHSGLEKGARRAALQWSQLNKLISQLAAHQSDITGV